MALVKTLLTAIVRTDGDALVMHVGEKPYVVTANGNVELSSAGLNLEAMSGMLTQLLPADAMRSLSEFGAVEHHLQPPQGMRDAFTVVAARGGDDIWIEIRRKRAVVPTEVHPAAATTVAVTAETFAPAEAAHAHSEVAIADTASQRELSAQAIAVDATDLPAPTRVESAEPPAVAGPHLGEVASIHATPDADPVEHVDIGDQPQLVETAEARPSPIRNDPAEEPEVYEIAADAPDDITSAPTDDGIPMVASVAHVEAPAAPLPPAAVQRIEPRRVNDTREATGPAVVLPMTRTLRIDVPPRTPSAHPAGMERLLGFASASGASALYLTSQSRPLLRIDGDIRAIEGEPALTSAHVEAAMFELMPDSAREAHARGEPAEWVSEFDMIGRVRCSTFKDHRGAGALFQLMTAKPMSAEQLGFAREIRELATESDGLVLVAGPQRGGKSTVVAGLVDVVNRTRGAYVITLERQIRIVHEHHRALVSQREVQGEDVDIVSVARAALRENPDVLVIEDLYGPDLIQLALDAAGTGVLVFLSVAATSTVSAITRLVEAFPPEHQEGVQAALAERLRGAVSQVLLRTRSGGRVAARELLLTTAAVATLIGDGHFGQLTAALDSGRAHGMVSLNGALHELLQSGVIDVREAYRKSDDRSALFGLLKRNGVDTSLVERLLA